MSDLLQAFFDETSVERFDIREGGCGVWAIRWNIRKTGRAVPLPAVTTWEEAAALDMVQAFHTYVELFGLQQKDEPARGDVGLFGRTAKFERRGDHVIGIYAGGGFWAFKGMTGLKYLREEPLEVWG